MTVKNQLKTTGNPPISWLQCWLWGIFWFSRFKRVESDKPEGWAMKSIICSSWKMMKLSLTYPVHQEFWWNDVLLSGCIGFILDIKMYPPTRIAPTHLSLLVDFRRISRGRLCILSQSKVLLIFDKMEMDFLWNNWYQIQILLLANYRLFKEYIIYIIKYIKYGIYYLMYFMIYI